MSDFSPDNLLDVLELIDRIEKQTGALNKDGFVGNIDVQDATSYRLIAIGEAVRCFPEDLRNRHIHIPWRQITTMRNILAHEYFVTESEIIWETIKLGLPELKAVCLDELSRLESLQANKP